MTSYYVFQLTRDSNSSHPGNYAYYMYFENVKKHTAISMYITEVLKAYPSMDPEHLKLRLIAVKAD